MLAVQARNKGVESTTFVGVYPLHGFSFIGEGEDSRQQPLSRAVLVEALLFSTPPGWATVSAAVFLLAGVQLMVLWLIGEYLGRLYITANHKPQFVVRSVVANETQTGRSSGVTSVRPNAGCDSGPTSLTANKP